MWLDESEYECTSYNLCADIAPEVFDLFHKMGLKPKTDLDKSDSNIWEAVIVAQHRLFKFNMIKLW